MSVRFLCICASFVASSVAWSPPAEAQLPLRYGVTSAPREADPRRDANAERAEDVRKTWMLSLEAVTHAPVDMGAQLGLETPQGFRASAGYGFVPGGYMSLLTGIAANASGDSYARPLLEDARYSGKTWRVQIGLRPFRKLGLYTDVGYSRLSARGDWDLASSGVPQLAALGGGYQARTTLDLWLLEIGYQGQVADRLVLGVALGCMGTFGSSTSIVAVDGAPTDNAILTSAASQADAALRRYGYVPTLTLRLGFDLI
ncbi:MAG: hypothetical protein EOO73_18480 [Myxococcales bacterium]|nr:MAG: hypothetical protein EOO73_18480 [Myxococcales bacterium]